MESVQIAVRVLKDALNRRNIEARQIFLFGSRARGEASPESDWDFYVLIDGDLPFARRREIITEIKRELAKLRIPNDVILTSSRKFELTKRYPGHLAYEVAREGEAVL